jgi:membrane protease subunit HflC
MNNKAIIITVIVVALIAIFILLGPFYIVNEGQYAVVVRLGEVTGTQTGPGLKLKLPFVDEVVFYSKKVQAWDGIEREMPDIDRQTIVIDTTARWKIDDPEVFYSKFQKNPGRAFSLLDGIIESAVTTVISNYSFFEAVRSTNAILDEVASGQQLFDAPNVGEIEELSSFQSELRDDIERISESTGQTISSVSRGRDALTDEMLNLAQIEANSLGIDLLDIVIRRVSYQDETIQAVYDRMVSERRRIAQFYRSYGEGIKSSLLGELESETDRILSDAYRQSQEIRGNADAEAAAIYADAYNLNPEFFEFWRSIDSYGKTMQGFDKTITTDMEYFKYLYNPEGN